MENPAAQLETYSRVAEISPWPVMILNSQGQLRSSNSSCRKLFHSSIPLNAGTPLTDLIRKKDQSKIHNWFESFVAESHRDEVEDNATTPSTSVIPNSIRCRLHSPTTRFRKIKLFAQRFMDSDQCYVMLCLDDTGHRIKKRQAIHKQQQLMLSLLDNTGAVAYAKNLRGQYLYINSLFEELFHVNRQAVKSMTDYDIFNAAAASAFQENDLKIIQNGEMQRSQEVVPHDDGLHTYISAKFPLYDANGDIFGIGGISTDITEQLHNQQELQAAQAVQRLLYPDEAPSFSGYDIAGSSLPAESVSGDYYDYITVAPNRVVVAVGDVSGHGLGPALEMVEVRSYLRAILRTEVRLDVAMECLNEFLFHDLRECAFVTLFLAEINFQTHSFSYVGAGHRADFLKANGDRVSLPSTGLMLGVEERVTFVCSPQFAFEQGDELILSTDGICETMTPEKELFGREGMLKFVESHRTESASEIVNNLLTTCQEMNGLETQSDDMTAVLVKRG